MSPASPTRSRPTCTATSSPPAIPGAPLRVMLAGHCDQIGLIVQHIDDDGFLYVQPIGGWDPEVLIGQRMTVWTAGGPIPGVIARKPIHLLTEEERKQVPKMKDLWLDIGATRQGRRLQGGPHRRRGHGRACSSASFATARRCAAAMDDKAGLWVVSRPCAAPTPASCAAASIAVSTVQEELGLRGAQDQRLRHRPAGRRGRRRDPRHRLPDHREEGGGRRPLGQRAGDPSRPEHESQGGRAAVGRGRRAAASPINWPPRPRPRAPTPTPSRSTAPAWPPALISIPNRYMHSPVETISLDDIDRAADLLARFVEGFDARRGTDAVGAGVLRGRGWRARPLNLLRARRGRSRRAAAPPPSLPPWWPNP